MVNERKAVQTTTDLPEKCKFIMWVKFHKKELLYAGIGVMTVLTAILCLKNKDEIIKLWNSLKERLEEGPLYSEKWFDASSVAELYEERARVQDEFRNPELDIEYRDHCKLLLDRFDMFIQKKQDDGKEYIPPVHGEHGLYLLSDD